MGQRFEVAGRVFIDLERMAIGDHGAARRGAVSGQPFSALGVLGQLDGGNFHRRLWRRDSGRRAAQQ